MEDERWGGREIGCGRQEMGRGEGSETGLVMEGQKKSRTSIQNKAGHHQIIMAIL